MAKQIHKKPAVWHDLLEHVDFLSQRNPNAAERFLDAVEASFNFLAENPLLGGVCAFEHPAAQDLRHWSIRGFKNYVAFYRPLPNGVEIVRLLHAARNTETEFAKPHAD